MSTVKTKLAAAATLVGLGGLAGWAINQPAGNDKAAAAQAAAPVEVRTQVIRRTVHIVRHEKPKHRRKAAAAAAGAGGGGGGTGGGASAASVGSYGGGGGAPVTRSSGGGSGVPASSPAPSRTSRPVTRTSGSSGSGGSGGRPGASRGGDDAGEHRAGGDD